MLNVKMNAVLTTLTNAPDILSVCKENEEAQLKGSLGA